MDRRTEQSRSRSARGRPVVTSHAAIERAAFELFAEKGFAATTLDDIARAAGVGRRTVTRYYPSKNDIPWGQFADTLTGFATTLDETPADSHLLDAVHRGIVTFNNFPPGADPSHRDRMRLILTTPELQAHSVLKYQEWRGVIARFVARRDGGTEESFFPQLVGQVSLALALTSYDQWLADEHSDIVELLEQSLSHLRRLARK